MKEKLSMLVDLQGIDDALRDLRESRKHLETITRDNKLALEGFDTMLAGLTERISETRGFYTEKEEEIRETETNIGRSKSRLNAITSQKELTALNKELETARQLNHKRNEELMRLLEQLEAAEANLKAKQAQRAQLAKDMALVEKDQTDRIAEKERSAQALNERRLEIMKTIPRDLLARYERVSKGRNGLAVTAITQATCGGCNMAVPPQVFIRLQRMETIEQCANCLRILVYRAPAAPEGEVGLSE